MLANILVGVVILGLVFLLVFAWYVQKRHIPPIDLELDNMKIDRMKIDEVFPPAVVDKRQEIRRVELTPD